MCNLTRLDLEKSTKRADWNRVQTDTKNRDEYWNRFCHFFCQCYYTVNQFYKKKWYSFGSMLVCSDKMVPYQGLRLISLSTSVNLTSGLQSPSKGRYASLNPWLYEGRFMNRPHTALRPGYT